MSGFVVFRDHDGWFKWATAEWWDDPTYLLCGERVDTRVEITRHDTKEEARNVKYAYNMMVHGKPTSSDGFNRLLEQHAKDKQ